jgi:transcription-repair coupling factor (superfamily II helicase)
VLASYSRGARERLKGLLEDHGLKNVGEAAGWQEALGIAGKGMAALTVIQIDHGFTTGDVALLTEQDMLGDRLVRRRKRKKNTDAFLNELATLTPGDLVVHADHGIGRYEGLTRSRSRRARTTASRSAMRAATSSTCRSRISTYSPATEARARA